ncbi:sulfotransferase, partial [Methyloglobulus sp.]|uniref:sulfotransferase n=1 Tax=Methyloglobulus sp. TaxID=2518622 RepID=UPI0032B83335
MLGQLLDSLGLFSGVSKDENNEAIFFQYLNDWLLRQCGGRWDTPSTIEYLWGNEEILALTEDYARYLLDSPRAIQFLGLRRYIQMGGITRLHIPWGWKDPRNTFTLPFWLRIFTDAKVIYIERHGVDVAQSLRLRSQEELINATQKYRKLQKLAPFRPKREGFLDSPRCLSLKGGFSLWQEYVDQSAKVTQHLGENRVLKLKYEEVLENPVLHLRMCAEFCEFDVSDQKLESLTASIDSSRAYSYRNDPEL